MESRDAQTLNPPGRPFRLVSEGLGVMAKGPVS